MQLSLYSRLWIAGEAAVVVIPVTGVHCWAFVLIHFCVLFWYYGRLHCDLHVGYMKEGTKGREMGDCLLRLFCFVLCISTSCIDLLT
jgi:hypothetical protein